MARTARCWRDFDGLLEGVLPRARIGNDMVCSWAGSLGGEDGISLVAGTGSIAYGEWRRARRALRRLGRGLRRRGLGLLARARGTGAVLSHGRWARGAWDHCSSACAGISDWRRISISARRSMATRRAAGWRSSRGWSSAAAADGDAQAGALLTRAGRGARGDWPARWRDSCSCRWGPACRSRTPAASSRRARRSPTRCAPRSTRALPGAMLMAPRFGPELGAAMHAARLVGVRLGARLPLPPQPARGSAAIDIIRKFSDFRFP